MRIPLSNLTISDKAKQYANEALDSGWVSGAGYFIDAFESKLSYAVGRKHVIAVANGTLALEVALMALGVGPGDEVIVPALTFVAPAAAVMRVGAKPVFVDITADSWTLDPDKVSMSITTHTKAVIAVDVLGHSADYGRLYEVCRGIPIIEDAAEAHGGRYRQFGVGQWGMISTFSFHANKAVGMGEGGAVLCDSQELADKIRLIANHGMTKDNPYHHETVGTNARMTNLQAAIGLAQVEDWLKLVYGRRVVAARYDELLAGVIERKPVASWATENCWLYTVHHPDRKRLLEGLRSAGIDARAVWPALVDLPLYAPFAVGQYPIARKVANEAFWLPTWAGMDDDLITEVCGVLKGLLVKEVSHD